MARNTTITVSAKTWTQLTNADVVSARVQNYGAAPVYISATVGEIAPSNKDGSIVLNRGDAFASDMTLAQIWPGVSGANRLYAYCDVSIPVSISHA